MTFPTGPPAPPSGRDGAVDALRVFAALVVVSFHAAAPYVETPLRGLLLPLGGAPRSRLLDVLFWSSHGFQMPLFFLLSGLLAAPSLERLGARAFALARLRRLGLPLLLPGVPILVALYYTWCAGWWLDGRCTVREIRAVKFADQAIQGVFLGPAHLWFLSELLIVSLAWAALSTARVPLPRGRGAVAAGAVATAALLFAAPTVLTLFPNRFLPDPARLLYHALFFGAGAALAGSRQEARRPLRPAAALLGAALAFVPGHLVRPEVVGGSAGLLARAVFAVSAAAFAWTATLAALAFARGAAGPTGRRLDQVAGATYWIYLVHLPLVGAVQVALGPLGWPAVASWALATAGGFLGALATWQPVRQTRLGELLAGTSRSPAQRSLPAQYGHSGQLPPSG